MASQTVSRALSPRHMVPLICSRCETTATRAALRWTTASYGPAPSQTNRGGLRRSISTSPRLLKKGGKAARDEQKQAASGAEQDPFDFADLEADIARAVEQLKDSLSRLRASGRFNTDVLESLRVQPDKAAKATVRLRDLAQVIPKGRTVQILVGDQAHLKPVTSAIQGSNLSLTPQPDPTGANPQLLVINVPPPTADSRKAVVDEAKKAGEKASTAIRDARSKQQKKLRALQLDKSVRPDDVKKAGTQMEKVVANGSGEVKKIVDNATKALESG